jgi:lysozyme family protein
MDSWLMDNFDSAVIAVLEAEGGYSNRPSDSGGATNFGISLRFLREIPAERLRKYGIFEPLDDNTIKNLTQAQAVMIYRHEFWEAAHIDQLVDFVVAGYVLDMCVLHGIGQGIKILQRATWAAMGVYEYIEDDGIMGKQTVLVVNQICSSPLTHEDLIVALCAERAGFCRMLAEIRPKDRENLHGWLKRCYRI